MTAHDTFSELRNFWHDAYLLLHVPFAPKGHPSASVVEGALRAWVDDVLTRDGVCRASPLRTVFSAKPPEPFFGRWLDEDGQLDVRGKTVVALINPGNGITFEQSSDPDISIVGRPHWHMLKEFYTTGAVLHGGVRHALPYKRDLANPTYSYRAGTKHFGWGWWRGQWRNMLAAIGDARTEEDAFVTLELFAYSSTTANELSSDTVTSLKSSQLAAQLISDLLEIRDNAPGRIVLVNKRAIWEPLLASRGTILREMSPRNRAGLPKAYRAYHGSQPTTVPLVVLHQAQKMKFPCPGADAARIFADLLTAPRR